MAQVQLYPTDHSYPPVCIDSPILMEIA